MDSGGAQFCNNASDPEHMNVCTDKTTVAFDTPCSTHSIVFACTYYSVFLWSNLVALKVGFLIRVISVISVVLRKTTLTISVSIGEPVLMESEKVRVVSLSKKEISKINRLKIRSSGFKYLKCFFIKEPFLSYRRFKTCPVKREPMHLRKISFHDSLRNPRRLTWAETFRYHKFSAWQRTILHHYSVGCLPRLENYQFSQARLIFFIYGNTMYVFSIYGSIIS